jgi:hypothetical protein
MAFVEQAISTGPQADTATISKDCMLHGKSAPDKTVQR